jgi:pyruvate,orthophosphate dikinase
VLAELGEVERQVAPALAHAGDTIPRFARYGRRLALALQQADADPRFVASPLVDSFHTIWFECHEDFLVTLGRVRHRDDSW